MTDTLVIAALGLGAFWFFAKRAQARDSIAQKAIDVVGGINPTVSISNVEAIEERQVWVFQPTVDPSLRWRGSLVVDIAAAYESIPKYKNGPANFLSDHFETDSIRVVEIAQSGYTVDHFVDLVPGAFYDSKPRMGTLPFVDLRLEWAGTQYFYRGGPIPFNYRVIVPDEIWNKWWVTRIATVAEQVEAGGVILVPPTMK